MMAGRTELYEDDEMEPCPGKYNWAEAFRQNPDQPEHDVPFELMMRGRQWDGLPRQRELTETGGLFICTV
jgi:hypothetical protein